MEINVTQTLVDLAGKAMQSGTSTGEECPECGSPIIDDRRDLTLRTVCIEALTTQYDDETSRSGQSTLSAEKKIERSLLAQKIFQEDTSTLSSEEITLLKDLINKRYGNPLIVSQARDMLEGKSLTTDPQIHE